MCSLSFQFCSIDLWTIWSIEGLLLLACYCFDIPVSIYSSCLAEEEFFSLIFDDTSYFWIGFNFLTLEISVFNLSPLKLLDKNSSWTLKILSDTSIFLLCQTWGRSRIFFKSFLWIVTWGLRRFCWIWLWSSTGSDSWMSLTVTWSSIKSVSACSSCSRREVDPLNSYCGSCLFVLGAFRLTPDLLFFSDLSLKILDESFFN